ncbi:MAG: hypothetical protein EAZ24_12070, partial [Burkholderiales bacterium]
RSTAAATLTLGAGGGPPDLFASGFRPQLAIKLAVAMKKSVRANNVARDEKRYEGMTTNSEEGFCCAQLVAMKPRMQFRTVIS